MVVRCIHKQGVYNKTQYAERAPHYAESLGDSLWPHSHYHINRIDSPLNTQVSDLCHMTSGKFQLDSAVFMCIYFIFFHAGFNCPLGNE